MRLQSARLAIEAAQLELGGAVASTRRLAQQFHADTTVAGIVAVAAEHLAKAALSLHHALAGRLLEQATGNPFHAGGMPQPRAVQQPSGNANRYLGTDGKRIEG